MMMTEHTEPDVLLTYLAEDHAEALAAGFEAGETVAAIAVRLLREYDLALHYQTGRLSWEYDLALHCQTGRPRCEPEFFEDDPGVLFGEALDFGAALLRYGGGVGYLDDPAEAPPEVWTEYERLQALREKGK